MLNENQRKLLEVLKNSIINDESLSMQEMAVRINVDSPNTVLYHIRKLEDKGLVARNENGKVIRVNSPDDAVGAVAFLPLLGSARCGTPLDQIESDIVERMLPIPLKLLGHNSKKRLYLIKAIGDSMSPMIQDTDIVIFEANKSPNVGNIVIARTKEGSVVKRFQETSYQYLLESENPKYAPLVFDKASVGTSLNIDGVAVGLFKSKNSLEGGD